MDQRTSARQYPVDTNLWDQAFARLTIKDPELAKKYERVLQDGMDTPASANLGLQMRAVVDKRLRALQATDWTLKFHGKDLKVRDQVDRIIKVVIAVQDLGNKAAAVDPLHAGLPWAGVCLLLPVCPLQCGLLASVDLWQLLVNALKGRGAAITGLEAIAILIPRYAEVEKVYLGNGGEASEELRNAIVELYTNILEYQIEVARYFAQSAFQRFAKATFQPSDWDDRLQRIKSSDDDCKSLITVCDAAYARSDVCMMKDMLKKLDNGIQHQISAILMSRNIVAWDPGPNSDANHLSILYSGHHGRASSFRIPLADIENDEQLFRRIQRDFASRQHRLWRWEVRHPTLSLGLIDWYDVQKIEYVKVRYDLGHWALRLTDFVSSCPVALCMQDMRLRPLQQLPHRFLPRYA